MRESETTRYLKGKKLPDNPSPVVRVLAEGDTRVVIHKNNTTSVMSKDQLFDTFKDVLSKNQHKEMEQTLVKHRDGTASVKVGGLEKGKTKTYVSPEAAKKALERRYGK